MRRASCLAVVSLLAAVTAACSSDAPPAAPAAPPPAAIPSGIEARPSGADDLVVATVAGHPVYASCVQAQAAHLGLGLRDALDQCIDFELLAQAAEARGLRRDPDVIDTWRREMVRALIDAELTPKSRFEDLPPDFVATLLAQKGKFLQRPEIRLSHYARIEVPKDAVLDGPEDQAAHAAADAVYAELGSADGVLPDELVAVATRHAGTMKVDRSKAVYVTPEHDTGAVRVAVPQYRQALYAIPALGRISPPVRTKWGWDLILWWDTWPAADLTDKLVDSARQSYFAIWTDQRAAELGLTPWVDDAVLAGLAEDAP